jgi:hypothetical protein
LMAHRASRVYTQRLFDHENIDLGPKSSDIIELSIP